MDDIGRFLRMAAVPIAVLAVLLPVLIVGQLLSQILHDCPPRDAQGALQHSKIPEASTLWQPRAPAVVALVDSLVNGLTQSGVTSAESIEKSIYFRDKGNPLFCKTDPWWDILKQPLDVALREVRPRSAPAPVPPDATGDTQDTARADWQKAAQATFGSMAIDAEQRVNAVVANALAAIAALLGLMFALGTAIRRYAEMAPRGLPTPALLVVLGAAATGVGLYVVADAVIRHVVFAGVLHYGADTSYLYFFKDNFIELIFKRLAPGMDYVMGGRSDLQTAWALATLLALLVTLVGAAPSPEQQVSQAAFLTSRLKTQMRTLRRLLFASALVMATSVYCTSAQYAWPAALLGRGLGSEQPIFDGFIASLVTGYGVFFSISLLTLFGTAMLLVGAQARALAGALHVGGSQADINAWLENEGLNTPSLVKLSEVMAAFAPLLTGYVTSWMTGLFA